MKGDTKCTSANSLSPLGAQKKGLGAALQTLLGMDGKHQVYVKLTAEANLYHVTKFSSYLSFTVH